MINFSFNILYLSWNINLTHEAKGRFESLTYINAFAKWNVLRALVMRLLFYVSRIKKLKGSLLSQCNVIFYVNARRIPFW